MKNKYHVRYYAKNQERLSVYRKNHKRERKAYLVSLAGGKCIKCGYSECIGVLQFHHINPDEKTSFIHDMSLEKAIKEIQKCILLCANCHGELHYVLEEGEYKHE